MSAVKRILFGLVLLASTASAKTWRDEKDWEFGLHPGAAIAAGSYRHLAMSGFMLGGSIAYNVSDLVVAGVEGGYVFGHRMRGTTRDPLYLDLDADGTRDEIPFKSNVRDYIGWAGPMVKFGPWLHVGAESRWKPYMIGGFGFYHERLGRGELELTGGATSNGTQIVPGTKIQVTQPGAAYFGWDGGVGFEVEIDENGGIGAEARWRTFYRHGEDYKALVPSLRLLYYF